MKININVIEFKKRALLLLILPILQGNRYYSQIRVWSFIFLGIKNILKW